MKLFRFIMTGLLLFGVLTQAAQAAPNDKPTQSVTTNADAKKLGIYASTSEGAKACLDDLETKTVVFYQPTDLRGFDPEAKTAPLEKSDCWRLRVKGGKLGIVALREGALVNMAMRDGRLQPVAYNPCNNYLEAIDMEIAIKTTVVDKRETSNITLPTNQAVITITKTEKRTVNEVTLYEDTTYTILDGNTVVVDKRTRKEIDIPSTDYQDRYVERPVQPAAAQPQRCICYWPPNDLSVTQLYEYPELDRYGQKHCVPYAMVINRTPPPGFVR